MSTSRAHSVDERYVTKTLFCWVIGGVVALGIILWQDAKYGNSDSAAIRDLREDIRGLQQLLMRAEGVRQEAHQAVQVGLDDIPHKHKPTLSTGEYGELVGISSREVLRRVKSGEIPGVTFTSGGHARIANPHYCEPD